MKFVLSYSAPASEPQESEEAAPPPPAPEASEGPAESTEPAAES